MKKNLLFAIASGTFFSFNLTVCAPEITPGQLYHLESLTINRIPESVFSDLIEKNNVVAIFSAPWCGPCKALQPHVTAVAPKFNNVIFIKINTDAFQPLATRYGIRNIPTIICFKDGIKISQFGGGGLTRSALETKINSLFN